MLEIWNPFLVDLVKDLVEFIERAKFVRSLDREEIPELLLRAKTALEEIDRIKNLENKVKTK